MSVGVEFYGGNQPFQSLEKLEFMGMSEWEEWLPSPGGGESPDFPRLKELNINRCPKLRGNLLTHLPSLKKLSVSYCGVLHENRASNTLNTKTLPRSLEEVTIYECPGLSWLLESTEMLPSLQMLSVNFFGGTERLPQMVHNSNRLQRLTLSYCSSLLSLPRNSLPTTLTSLEIVECRKLEFLSRDMMANLTSLQTLYLSESCESLRVFPLGIFPKLSSLSFIGCQNLELLSVERADENLSHLNNIYIHCCPNLVSFRDGGLPTPNLTSFRVSGCENLELLPDRMHTLTALRTLEIEDVPNLVSFAQGGLPPNLQSFWIINCERLRPSVEWRLQRLASLHRFWIGSNQDLLETLLEEQLLPTTLHTLEISQLSNLKSLDGKALEHLTSLKELQIGSCESLEFLPKEGFPASLSYLSIRDCPSLKKRYRTRREKIGET
ncbi:putative disease resistance protein At3g14460 [Pyrus x bretschneideri]|uniref:putative disease resistance protein At3g14460 n=1 Tax=Pyrus x bretschneideri TaxID=225117 RepID=UPI00202F02D5|nr:putative disease resistance protein At3g14460 [Pyrus x bretschneideri]